MTSHEIFKCILQLFLIIISLFVVYIPYRAIESMIGEIFYGIGKSGIIIFNILEGLLNIAYLIFSIIIFFYIYKTRFLDKYEVKSQETKEEQDNISRSNNDNIPKQIIIKEKKVKETSKIINLLGKTLTIFIKGFVLLFTIPFIIGFIILLALLVIALLLIFKGILYVGPIIIIISALVFLYLLINVVFNFIFNNKNNSKILFILLIVSLLLGGIGIGITAIEISSIKYIDENTVEPIKANFEIKMENNLVIESRYVQEYVVNNNIKNIKIDIEYYDIYSKPQIDKYNNIVVFHFYNNNLFEDKKVINQILEDLKNKEIHNYDNVSEVKITITANKENIAKLKENIEKYQQEEKEKSLEFNRYQEEINELNEMIEDLNEEIESKEASNQNLKENIQELEEKINKYKELLSELE